MKVKYAYDQDPRYGWVNVDIGDEKEVLIIVYSEEDGSRGFTYGNGEMVPTCICSARTASECACPNVYWGSDDYK